MLFQNTGVPEVDFQTEASRLIILNDLRCGLPGVDPERTSLPEREFRTQGAFGEVASLAPATEIELRFAMDTVRHAHWSAEWDRRCVAAGDDLKAATRAQVNAIARLRASIAASREVSRLQRERHERSLKWSNQMAFFEDGKATNLLLARLLDKSSGTTFAEAMVRHTEVLAEANARAEKIAEEAAATARAELEAAGLSLEPEEDGAPVSGPAAVETEEASVEQEPEETEAPRGESSGYTAKEASFKLQGFRPWKKKPTMSAAQRRESDRKIADFNRYVKRVNAEDAAGDTGVSPVENQSKKYGT